MGLAPDLGVNRGPCPQGPRGRGRGKVDVSQATHMGESGVGISVLGHRGDRVRDPCPSLQAHPTSLPADKNRLLPDGSSIQNLVDMTCSAG